MNSAFIMLADGKSRYCTVLDADVLHQTTEETRSINVLPTTNVQTAIKIHQGHLRKSLFKNCSSNRLLLAKAPVFDDRLWTGPTSPSGALGAHEVPQIWPFSASA